MTSSALTPYEESEEKRYEYVKRREGGNINNKWIRYEACYFLAERLQKSHVKKFWNKLFMYALLKFTSTHSKAVIAYNALTTSQHPPKVDPLERFRFSFHQDELEQSFRFIISKQMSLGFDFNNFR